MNEKPADPSKSHLRIERGGNDQEKKDDSQSGELTPEQEKEKLDEIYRQIGKTENLEQKKWLIAEALKLEKDIEKVKQLEFALRQLLLS